MERIPGGELSYHLGCPHGGAKPADTAESSQGVGPKRWLPRAGQWRSRCLAIEQTEGAKFWLKVFTDLRARVCEDILIAVTDALKGMPEALEAAHPKRPCRPVSCS